MQMSIPSAPLFHIRRNKNIQTICCIPLDNNRGVFTRLALYVNTPLLFGKFFYFIWVA